MKMTETMGEFEASQRETPEASCDYGDVIAERRAHIRDTAPCQGCGAGLADCEARRGADPTAPSWFGCCARGLGMEPCGHVQSVHELSALLDEIAAGRVRTVAEITAERDARKDTADRRRGPLTGSIFDQGAWWRQRDGSFIRIAEMTPGHRYNSAALFLRAAAAHAWRYVANIQRAVPGEGECGDLTMNSLEHEFDKLSELTTRDPAGWMRETVLYRALTAGLKIQGDGTKPWQATGRDPVSGEETEVPPPMTRSCELPSCGCSGEVHP